MASLLTRLVFSTKTPSSFPQIQQCRSLWMTVKGDSPYEAERTWKQMNQIMMEDGSIKDLRSRRRHEKKSERRVRKKGESSIRRANRRVGTMIQYIMDKKEAGY